jgi:hypothetical protein
VLQCDVVVFMWLAAIPPLTPNLAYFILCLASTTHGSSLEVDSGAYQFY